MAIEEQISSVASRIDDAHRDLAEGRLVMQRSLAKFNACHKMLHSLMDASAVAGHMPPPGLVWISPCKTTLGERLFRPTSWLFEPVRITFVCPFTFKVAQCGDDGKGFRVRLAKERIAKAAPYLLVGYEALRWACAAGRLVGLPLPQDQVLAVEKFPLLVERLQGTLESINEHLVSATRSKRVRRHLEECALLAELRAGECVSAAQMELLKGFSDDARTFLREVLREIPDWTTSCGLEHVTADDGTSVWVHPDGGRDAFLKARAAGKNASAEAETGSEANTPKRLCLRDGEQGAVGSTERPAGDGGRNS